jgi:hypothetical protein
MLWSPSSRSVSKDAATSRVQGHHRFGAGMSRQADTEAHCLPEPRSMQVTAGIRCSVRALARHVRSPAEDDSPPDHTAAIATIRREAASGVTRVAKREPYGPTTAGASDKPVRRRGSPRAAQLRSRGRFAAERRAFPRQSRQSSRTSRASSSSRTGSFTAAGRVPRVRSAPRTRRIRRRRREAPRG